MSSREPIEIAYEEVLRDKPQHGAILFKFPDGNEPIWIPRSQILEHDEELRVVTIPEWLAYQEGLI